MSSTGANRRMILIALVMVSFGLMVAPLHAAVSGTQSWVRRFNGSASQADRAEAIAVDKNGNVFVAGSSEARSIEDFVTIKYNSAGTRKWVRRYDGGVDDFATHIAVDKNGNVYVTGKGYFGSHNKYDYVTIKYDTYGRRKWVKRYNGSASGNDVPAGISTDPSGNVIVTGTSCAFRSGALDGENDILTLKYAPNGVLRWKKRLKGITGGNEGAKGLAVDRSGNVLVTGFSVNSAGNPDYLTAKYAPNGVRKWAKRYDGSLHGYDFPVAIGVDASGGVYVTGKVPENTNAYPPLDTLTIRYSASGALKWAKSSGIAGNDEPTGLVVDRFNNAAICGHATISGNTDFLIVKYGSGGVEKWSIVVDSSAADDVALAIAADYGGNSYVAGHTNMSDIDDYLTVKLDPNGSMKWYEYYAGPGGDVDWSHAIAVDKTNGVYVAGESYGGTVQSWDFATIKYIK